MSNKSPSILHAPTNVGGHASSLVEAERAIGLNSQLLSLYGNYINYESDECWHLEEKSIFGKLYGHFKAALKAREYDVLHFNYGSTFLHFLNRGVNTLDLPLYSKQKVFFTFNGCDVRQKDLTMQRRQNENEPAACFNPECYNGMCNSGFMDKNRRKTIDKITDKATHIFALNPDLLHFLPKEKASFMPYVIKGGDGKFKRTRDFFENDVLRIVHAPTDRGAKGTHLILEALELLKEKYPKLIEVILVEKIPHKEALAIYANADLVIDQILIGWYGGLAVEVMQMGVPVMSYINPFDLHFIPQEMAQTLPIISIHARTLLSDIEKIIKHPEQLKNSGKLSKIWVEKWHNAHSLALKMNAAYQ